MRAADDSVPAAAVGRGTPKLRDVRDAFEKFLDPKKMFAVKSKPKPSVVLTPCVQEVPMGSIEVKGEPVEPVAIKLEQLIKHEHADYETDYSYTYEAASEDSPRVATMAFEIGSDSDVLVEVGSSTVHPDELCLGNIGKQF